MLRGLFKSHPIISSNYRRKACGASSSTTFQIFGRRLRLCAKAFRRTARLLPLETPTRPPRVAHTSLLMYAVLACDWIVRINAPAPEALEGSRLRSRRSAEFTLFELCGPCSDNLRATSAASARGCLFGQAV